MDVDLTWDPPSKRVFDVVVILLATPVLLPVLVACAVAVRIDSAGPVVFTQTRTGRHGRTFELLKFRTMVADAERMKAQLQHLNELEPPDFKITDDPRITRIGRWLRSTSLDELPQVWNIMRGDMSIVGPRPTSFAASTYDLWQTRRLEARPGLTGLWQVSGRHTTSFDDRARLDEQYLRSWSIWLDIRIIVRTIPALLRREGA